MFADFCWYAIFDWSSTNRTKQLVTHFFYPELEFFVLDFNVDHSKPMRLSFYHVLSWFANITNSKPNTKFLAFDTPNTKNQPSSNVSIRCQIFLAFATIQFYLWNGTIIFSTLFLYFLINFLSTLVKYLYFSLSLSLSLSQIHSLTPLILSESL